MALSLLPRRFTTLFDDLLEPRLWPMVPRLDTETAMLNWRPTCDVRETENAYMIYAEIPGAKKEDVKIQLDGNRLTISGSVKDEKKTDTETMHMQERSYGTFSRMFTLPQNAKLDNINAVHNNGILEVSIPKVTSTETARDVKTIKIN